MVTTVVVAAAVTAAKSSAVQAESRKLESVSRKTVQLL
jgi:hypothetical protein